MQLVLERACKSWLLKFALLALGTDFVASVSVTVSDSGPVDIEPDLRVTAPSDLVIDVIAYGSILPPATPSS
jgi:hypothetical protein